jgi:hypothetical protein
MKKILLISFSIGFFLETLFPQVTPETQKYRDDPYGNPSYRKRGELDGNLIRTAFFNDGQVGTWVSTGYPGPSGEWPKGTQHNYIDGCTPLVVARVQAPGNGQIIHPTEASYREEIDEDPLNPNIKWVTQPVPGYARTGSEEPAVSLDSLTWPAEWPDALNLTDEWNSFWYGYFGRGVQNADVETFFVLDDSQDKEFARQPYFYYPIAADSNRGGLGLRIEVRGFQWSHVLAEDIIFWHYDIVNISDHDYDSTFFGFYCDTGVGGTTDNGDDMASYDTKLDLAYAFDYDGIVPPLNWQTGYVGYAFLESPGNGFNSFDDDEDGIVDERRDDGIDNDQDWIGYIDINSNGKWDAEENEPLNDDVGKDGVGPLDRQYFGPDEGEGDGLPTDGEPNFDKTDKDESDQIGLTSLAIERLSNKGPSAIWPKNDDVIYQKMNNYTFDTTVQNSNIQILFGSGPFPLQKNRRERFSVALVFGDNLEDLTFNKETVQQIYNANYNFARPPYKPTLTAVASDKKVYLYWDKVAEESRDPFLGYEPNDQGVPDFRLGYKKDFEGYLLYRSEEPEFNDIKVITDSRGSTKYWKPIAQFDIVDTIKGPDPIGINGAHFWRGSNTGLQHAFIDTNVVNGQTYYYACVSYDEGDPNFGTQGLIPSECTKIISQDVAGNIQFVDINCAVVTPNAPVAGYVAPQIEAGEKVAVGTGNYSAQVIDPASLKDGAQYKVEFRSNDTSYFPLYKTTSLQIVRNYNGVTDTVERNIDALTLGRNKFTSPFDGIILSVLNDTVVSVIEAQSGWLVKGQNNILLGVSRDYTVKALPWPSNYELQFSGESFADTTFFTKIPVPLKIINTTTGRQVDIELKDVDQSGSLTVNDTLQIVEFIRPPFNVANSRISWNISYSPPLFPVQQPIYPEAGDRYLVSTTKPYKTGDYFTFTAKSAKVDNSTAKNQLDKINVVPNPYVATNVWEKRTISLTGRGERRIDFTNLPVQCTIRIYTVAGALVKTIIKNSSPADGSISWNLVSEDGMDIAYGLYIYHVDAPGIGEKIGKFAIIK